MIIVNGTFEVEPDQRDAFLAERLERMRTSRAEAGCRSGSSGGPRGLPPCEYAFAADPLQPGRVVLFERWESQEHLDDHLAGPSPATNIAARHYAITLYDVTNERPLA